MIKSVLIAATFAAAAFAQNIAIGVPLPGNTIFPGEQLGVEVVKPDSLTSSRDIAVEISLAHIGCDNPTCAAFPGPATVLFSGPYNPQVRSRGTSAIEDFAVMVPSSFQQGDVALLVVKHWAAVGVSEYETFDSQNVTLKVVQPPSHKRAVAGRVLV